MTNTRLSRSLRALRRGRTQSDNLVVMPASALPFKKEWQRLANALPPGEVLFVVPIEETPIRASMRRAAVHLRRRGCRITAVESARFSPTPRSQPENL